MVVLYSYDPNGFIYLDDSAADAMSALADYLVAIEGGSARVEPSRVHDDVHDLVSRLRSEVLSANHPFTLALNDLLDAFDSEDDFKWVDALSYFLARFDGLLCVLRPIPGQPELF